MARTAMTVTTTSSSGTVLPAAAAVDAANGNTFPNTGRERIDVINGSGAPITVTIITYGTYAVGTKSYAIADSPVTIAAGVTKTIGPFDKALYNNPSNGNVEVDYSSGTTVTAIVTALGTD